MAHKSRENYAVKACVGPCKWRGVKCSKCIGKNKREKPEDKENGVLRSYYDPD